MKALETMFPVAKGVVYTHPKEIQAMAKRYKQQPVQLPATVPDADLGAKSQRLGGLLPRC